MGCRTSFLWPMDFFMHGNLKFPAIGGEYVLNRIDVLCKQSAVGQGHFAKSGKI